jgi:hypothetical protein
MKTLPWLMWVAACSGEPSSWFHTGEKGGWDAAEQAALAPPAPPELSVARFHEGSQARLTVRGLPPGERAAFFASTTGVGAPSCLPGGACVQLLDRQMLGARRADASGVATLRVPVHVDLVEGDRAWLQAVAGGRVASVATSVVPVDVAPACDGWVPADYPTLGEGVAGVGGGSSVLCLDEGVYFADYSWLSIPDLVGQGPQRTILDLNGTQTLAPTYGFELRHLSVRNGVGPCIATVDDAGLELVDVEIYDCAEQGLLHEGGDIDIERVHAHHNGGAGVEARVLEFAGYFSDIHNSVADHNGGAGISLYMSIGYLDLEDLSAVGNAGVGVSASGVEVGVTGLEALDNGEDGLAVYVDDHSDSIVGSVSAGNGGAGVDMYAGPALLADSLVVGNGSGVEYRSLYRSINSERLIVAHNAGVGHTLVSGGMFADSAPVLTDMCNHDNAGGDYLDMEVPPAGAGIVDVDPGFLRYEPAQPARTWVLEPTAPEVAGMGGVDAGRMRCIGKLHCEAVCDDGADDDQDTLVDCADPDCNRAPSCRELDCADGVDDDGDGLVDCADPGCAHWPICAEVCGDGADNDGDGATDCDDFDCRGVCTEVCGDGIDNDADLLADCADPDCGCPEICGNGLDDDFDGVADCLDDDCACVEGSCTDGADGDLDGLVDCADDVCFEDVACADVTWDLAWTSPGMYTSVWWHEGDFYMPSPPMGMSMYPSGITLEGRPRDGGAPVFCEGFAHLVTDYVGEDEAGRQELWLHTYSVEWELTCPFTEIAGVLMRMELSHDPPDFLEVRRADGSWVNQFAHVGLGVWSTHYGYGDVTFEPVAPVLSTVHVP